MTREQFDTAVKEGYQRLEGFTKEYTREDEVHGPLDVLHNVLLEFRVKHMDKFTWRSQAEWEVHVQKAIVWNVTAIRDNRAYALDFKDTVINDDPDRWPEGIDPNVDPLKHAGLSSAFHMAIKALDNRERQVVLGILAGFTQEEIGLLLDVSRQRVTQIWAQALLTARGYMQSEASGESRSPAKRQSGKGKGHK